MRFLFTCVLVTLTHSHAHAGAWPQPADNLFVSVQSSYFTSNDFFDADGQRHGTLPYNKIETRLYTEYGLSDHYTIGANLAYAVVQQQYNTTILTDGPFGLVPVPAINGDANRAFVDPEFFLRGPIKRSNFSIFSWEALLKLPSQIERNTVPQAGTEETDFEFALLAGHSFEWLGAHHFLDARLGYRFRDEGLGNQTIANVRAGFSLWDDLQIIPTLYTIWADEVPSTVQFARTGREDYDLMKAELSFIYKFDEDYDVTLSGFSHIYGKNFGDGNAITTGINYRF